MELTDDTGIEPTDVAPPAAPDEDSKETREQDKQMVASLITEIKADKKHHEKAFKQMRTNMDVVRRGAVKDRPDDEYRANIIGRHVKTKTAALYAKNPKIAAKRKETLDFAVWDETPEALQLAQMVSQQVQMAVAQAQATPPQIDPLTGMAMPVQPVMPPGADQALAVMQDFQQGMQRREFVKKYSKTLEILMGSALREQKPLEFKEGMKQTVRRTVINGVGYVELGYQREYGPRPGMTEKLSDARARLDHLKRLTEEVGEGEIADTDAEMAELEYSVQQLQSEPEVVLREGLILDYPASTKVIPDRLCKSLVGFVGARRVAIEYSYTVDQVTELFGVDIGDSYTSYSMGDDKENANFVPEDNSYSKSGERNKDSLVCVWKVYDKASGLCSIVADGYDGWLRAPAAPDVFVEDFWPVYALTFNDLESETDLYPPSDVELLMPMQAEFNRSRQGMREHRKAARPRWAFANGAFGDEEDPLHLANLKAFEALGLNIDPGAKLSDILQVIPTPGVDPNLYETNQIMSDIQVVSGAQEAQYGATSGATATQSAIAANSSNTTDGSAIDDLDGFLTRIARAGGQILQREMAEEKVLEIVGPGAVWPEMSLADIAGEVYLEIEAGSTGKPNQALEINNWKQIAPLLLQMPGINPTWLSRETLRRLDDRMDLTDAIIAGIPSIVMQNSQQQVNPADAASDPNQQGGQGANNAEKPNPGPGSDAPMGDNRDTPGQVANDPAMSDM